MLLVPRNATSVIARFLILDSGGSVIPDIAFNDPDLQIAYRRPTDASWQVMTLADGTLGTWGSNTFKHAGNGLYEYGIPNASIISDKATDWRITYDGVVEYDSLVAVAQGSLATNDTFLDAIREKVWTREERSITEPVSTFSSGPVFQFTLPSGEVAITANNTIYVKEKGIVLFFASDTDITSIPLKVIFENVDKTDIQVFTNAELTKTAEGFTLDLPDELTETERTIVWGIRHATTDRFFGRGSFAIVYAPHEDD